MTYGKVFAMALQPENLSSEEWDAFNAFFDEDDVSGVKIREESPALFSALLRLKKNQAKFETMDFIGSYASTQEELDGFFSAANPLYNVKIGCAW